ncbi:PocR ligand-binding domain-containing protein [Christensenellaceae bacterium NSJ-44]|uniref:PocR ligand-binding domain-containing protein n=1 Tax=Luoshenia tenuis TaxID=2763654 RepID=A0A926HIB2_9FIRM|nr:PocR ligand-binding domain-containing protein [Luoshenia tenuis]MBC8528602.1 PocR ligand-binding domain-containing protein [Luoshenia tenuis]SCJ60063.1 Bacillibactin transport regulator [uncultured Clostridium sp.]
MQQDAEIISVLKELYNISGCRMSLYDTHLREIAAYPEALSPFCALVRQNKHADHLCRRQDAVAFEIVRSQGQIYIYRCPFGLHEAVAPLYQYGVLSGFLMMGQILDSSQTDRTPIMRTAAPYVEDGALLEQRVYKIPDIPQDKLSSCIALMNICAAYITLSNRMNLADKNLAEDIRQYINQNFARSITLDHLSQQFFCSKPTLVGAFQRAYGQGINAYLTEVRLRHARSLLSGSKDSIRQIAQSCGFSDQNYFAKVFGKHCGCTPSAFRAQARQQAGL